jgi:hypothetical protein
MKINFECKGCKREFNCEMETIGIIEATMRPNFKNPSVCPRCGEKTMDEVLLTELGQSQLTEATMYL